MKPRSIVNRNPDKLKIPEGSFKEAYTPTAGRILSPSLQIYLEYCKFYLSVDSTVTYVDYAGNLVTLEPLKAGLQNFLVREIRTVTSGVCHIVHDGLQATVSRDMTSPLYRPANT